MQHHHEFISYRDTRLDVALLRLPPQTLPSWHVINIWGAETSSLYNIGRPVRVVGWGHTVQGGSGEMADCLHAVNLNIVYAGAREVRAGDAHRGGCYGDSGGALIAWYACNTPVHIGIVARGGGGGCRGESIFVRTSPLIPWLREQGALALYERNITVLPANTNTNTLCVEASHTFTINPRPRPGEVVTWNPSANLQHLGGGTFRALRAGTQADWVEAYASGRRSNRQQVWVVGGRPVIERIYERNTHTSTIRHYSAIMPPGTQWGLINSFMWELDPFFWATIRVYIE